MIKIIKVDTKGLEKKLAHAMNYVATEAKEDAKYRCPEVTGDLATSIEMTKKHPTEYDVGSYGIDYARHVEYGLFSWIPTDHGFHDPTNPMTTWKALRKRGEEGMGYTLPFLRPFAYDQQGLVKTFRTGFV